MAKLEPPRRTSSFQLILGIIVVLVLGAAIYFAVWAVRQHAREQALQRAAVQSPAAVESQGEVVAGQAPPAPLAEPVTVAPGPEPDYVWIGGWWSWEGGKWDWHPGYWAHRPHPGAVWVPHAWVHGPRGWVHSGGQWH